MQLSVASEASCTCLSKDTMRHIEHSIKLVNGLVIPMGRQGCGRGPGGHCRGRGLGLG